MLRSLQRYGLACAVALTPGQGGVLDTRACDSEAAGAGIPRLTLSGKMMQNGDINLQRYMMINVYTCVYLQ